jgi:hypothetical protein
MWFVHFDGRNSHIVSPILPMEELQRRIVAPHAGTVDVSFYEDPAFCPRVVELSIVLVL